MHCFTNKTDIGNQLNVFVWRQGTLMHILGKNVTQITEKFLRHALWENYPEKTDEFIL